MQLPSTPLTEEQSAAIVACIRLLAAHGRKLREERERREKATPAETMGIGTAGIANESTTHDRAVVYE